MKKRTGLLTASPDPRHLQRLQTVALEAAANGILITDCQGTILWANPALAEMTGYSLAELIGANPRIFKSGKQSSEDYQAIWETILADRVWHGVMINRRKDGSLYHEEQTIAPVCNETGEVTNFIAIKQDITLRIQAEAQLKAEAERSAILAEASVILTEVSLDYQVVLDTIVERIAHLVGDACMLHMLSSDQTQLELAAIHSLDPAHNAIIKEALLSPASQEQMETIQQVMDLKKAALRNIAPGGQYWSPLGVHSVMLIPVQAQDQLLGIITLLRYQDPRPFTNEDLVLMENLADRAGMKIVNTQLYRDLLSILQKEQSMRDELMQTEKFAALGRMVASVTHELNNPLQTIKNCLYLIQQELPEGMSLEFLDLATSEVQRLADLVSELRDVYRPRLADERQACDIGRLLTEVRALIAPFTARSQIAIALNLPDEKVILQAIPDQLKQVFLNISMNAVEAMQANGGELVINLFREVSQNKVGITFRDSGPGILPENIARIFEPLYTTKETGSGLGLSLSYDVVHQQGGEIKVESEPGKGTTFTIWLPEHPPAGEGQA